MGPCSGRLYGREGVSAAKVQSTRGEKESTPSENLESQRSGAHRGIIQAAPFLLAHLPLSNGIACVFRNWITILLTNKEMEQPSFRPAGPCQNSTARAVAMSNVCLNIKL